MKSLIYMNYSIYSLLYLSLRFFFLTPRLAVVFLDFRTREGGLAGIIPTIAISPMNSLVKATWELFAIVRISEKSLFERCPPPSPDGFLRLRRLLKALVRSYGLKCESIEEKQVDEPGESR